MKKNILYLNATADAPHVGCIAVTYSHLKKMFLRNFNVIMYGAIELKQFWKLDLKTSLSIIESNQIAIDISNSNIIVINGEGTIHHNKGLHLLAISKFCQSIGKAVFY